MRPPHDPHSFGAGTPIDDARDYVPDELLVRATVGASACFAAEVPRNAAERLHLFDCGDCQQRVEEASVDRGSRASMYVPAEHVVEWVLTRSEVARFRLPPSLRPVPHARRSQPVKRAAAAAIVASGLSPMVLAAAVLLHAAALGAGGSWLSQSLHVGGAPARAVAAQEQTTYVDLPAYPGITGSAEQSALARFRAGATREFGMAVNQSITVDANVASVARSDVARLSQTARLLRRFTPVRVRIECDSTRAAREQAAVVRRFLLGRGARLQQLSIDTGARVAGVRVVLDTVGELRP